MNEENSRRLALAFPSLYQKYGVSAEDRRAEYERSGGDHTVFAMQWGFECSDGWFCLIYDLSEQIMALAERYGVWPRASQVKEKFGRLQFYCHFSEGCNEEGKRKIRSLIEDASAKSLHICEFCGGEGVMRKSGWWHVSCDPCETLYQSRQLRGDR